MREFSRRLDVVVRLAAVAGLVAVSAACGRSSTTSTPPPTTYSIAGTVTGDVKAGVTVGIDGGRSTVTDANGQYRLRGLRDGSYTVTASLAGYTFTPATRAVTIAGANVEAQDFVATAGLSIAGTIGGDGGAGVTVTLTATGVPARSVVTDAEGKYRFLTVNPGTYLVTPTPAGGWTFSPANSLVTVVDTSLGGPDFTSVAPTHALSGRITGPFSAGVLVELSGAGTASTVTDGAGNYAFTDLPSGAYTVTPRRTGAAFLPGSRAVTVAAADVSGQDFASAATHKISGRVTGDVLAGVTVALTGAAEASATTDATGHFEFADLLDGSYTVTPALGGAGFSPASQAVTVAGADVTTLLFTASAAPTYRVSGTIGGAVQRGVTVLLQGTTTLSTESDATGAFDFLGVPAGEYLLIPVHEDYLFDPASRFVVVGADVTGQAFTASVNPTARTISGTVSGAATAGVTMTLVGPSPATTSRTFATDGAGAFAFRGLTDGLYLLTPSAAGFAFSPANCLVTIAGPSVSEVHFTSTFVPHRISGRVTGSVVAGVAVALDGDTSATTVTAADGTYAFTGLPNGSYTVTPAAPGTFFSPGSATVTLDGFDRTDVDFTAAPTHAISGVVTGDVQAGVLISLAGPLTATATTDASGRFTFPDLPSGGYVVIASADGYAFEPQRLDVDLAAVDVTNADFTAALVPTYTASGTVTGSVVVGVSVTLTGGSGVTATATTDAAGRYAFPALRGGSYMVVPSSAATVFAPASRAFRIDRTDVTGQDFTSAPAP